MAVYTYLDFKNAVLDTVLDADISSALTIRTILNRVVRQVLSRIDLRSTEKKATASPNLFNDIYDYTCPTDLKGIALIDVAPQINRAKDSDIRLTTEEEFDRRKTADRMMAAFSENVMVRKLKISLDIDDEELVVSELDSLTSGGGTWTLFGDGTNLRSDSDNFVKGNGSINWDISAAGGTTAGFYNDDLDEFDITDFVYAGSVFVWHYITSITNITNYILKIGNSSSVYFTKTITTQHNGAVFANGWNLLKFDLYTATQVGIVDQDACKYVALYMTKAAGKISETDYRFDWMVIKRGKIYEVSYYSKYGWQDDDGVWIENSTADTDYLNADTEELDLFVLHGKEAVLQEIEQWERFKIARQDRIDAEKSYKLKYPSKAKLLMTTYYNI